MRNNVKECILIDKAQLRKLLSKKNYIPESFREFVSHCLPRLCTTDNAKTQNTIEALVRKLIHEK